MSTRETAPAGAPCWADLWTSDVEGSRAFYGELFGWQAEEPSAEHGGYFMFTRDGVPVAGAMRGPEDIPAGNRWSVYFATDDIDKTVAVAEAAGATVVIPPMPVGDIGSQAALTDPTGAHVGMWQAGSFHGFSVLAEPSAPAWFELHTRDHATAVAFYKDVLGWETEELAGAEITYTTALNPDGEGGLAGVIDASAFLPEDRTPHWAIYWQVADVDASLETVKALGGSVVMEAQDTPFGRLATVADPAGAEFELRS